MAARHLDGEGKVKGPRIGGGERTRAAEKYIYDSTLGMVANALSGGMVGRTPPYAHWLIAAAVIRSCAEGKAHARH
jgi:hypothetical protein